MGDTLLTIFHERGFSIYGVNGVQMPDNSRKCTALCERPAAQTKSKLHPFEGFVSTNIHVVKMGGGRVNDLLVSIYASWLASGISTKANFVTRVNDDAPRIP